MDGTAGADNGNASIAADSSTASKVTNKLKEHIALNVCMNSFSSAAATVTDMLLSQMACAVLAVSL